MVNRIKIVLAQMEFNYAAVDHNIRVAGEAIKKAAELGNDLVLLPELWASGYDLKNWRKYATPLNQGTFLLMKNLSKRHNIAIGCSLLELRNGQGFNTFVFWDKFGDALGVYRKIHRFRLLDEEKWLEAGDRLETVDTQWGKIGLATCYDLRFPEVFRPYAISGVHLVLLVAEWPERRIDHWSKLLQARAIENQFYVAAVNKVGSSMGVKLGGRSMVVDPWGNPIVAGDSEPNLLMAEIDLSTTENAREAIPVLLDRRPDAYRV